MEIFGYLFCLLMGVTLGLMGGGGSILTVPILVYAFGIAPATATGYSLFIVGVTAFIGSILYLRKGEVDFKAGVSFALPSIIGVSLSRAWLIPKISSSVGSFGSFTLTKEVLIMILFATLMILASFSMIRNQSGRNQTSLSPLLRATLITASGFTVGIIAGFVGAGGGFLIIPALFLLAKLPMRIAVGTSLFIIASQSLFGFAGDVIRGAIIDWTLIGAIASIAIIGIAIGTWLSLRINEKKLKVGFGWFVLVMGAAILIEQIRHF